MLRACGLARKRARESVLVGVSRDGWSELRMRQPTDTSPTRGPIRRMPGMKRENRNSGRMVCTRRQAGPHEPSASSPCPAGSPRRTDRRPGRFRACFSPVPALALLLGALALFAAAPAAEVLSSSPFEKVPVGARRRGGVPARRALQRGGGRRGAGGVRGDSGQDQGYRAGPREARQGAGRPGL